MDKIELSIVETHILTQAIKAMENGKFFYSDNIETDIDPRVVKNAFNSLQEKGMLTLFNQKGYYSGEVSKKGLLKISEIESRYKDMEFAWISSSTRLYPSWTNIEHEKELFKEWWDGELGQNYINK